MSSKVPEQLRQYPLIRVCHPDNCKSHENCKDQGKRPVPSVEEDQSLIQINRWRSHGGNYGVVPRQSNDLVILDSDSAAFENIVEDTLPATFTVKSGNGKHFYYKCDYSKNEGPWSDPEGSLRADNWHCVGPGSIHPEGREYRVIRDRPISEVKTGEIEAVISKIEGYENVKNVQSGGGGGGGSAHHAHSVPDSLDFIQRDDHRQDIAEILKTESAHNRRLWMVGFLYSACGLRKSEIVDLIMKESRWSDLDRDTTEQQVQSVVRDKSRGTHYSNYSPNDGESGSDSPEGKRTQGQNMASNNDTSFTDKEEVTILEGSEPGDSFKKVVRVEIEDSDGSNGEYVALKKGRIDEMNTPDGDSVMVENVQDSVSLGNPDYLDDLVSGLEQLQEELDN